MRNAFLAMAAALLADKIWIVCQRDEMTIPDRTEKFMSDAGEIFTFLQEREIIVATPFADMDKTEMVAWYIEFVAGGKLTGDNLLFKTWSCYTATDDAIPCGACSACFRRFVAFQNNGLSEYCAADPRQSAIALEYLDRAGNAEFSSRRKWRILNALGVSEGQESEERQ